MTLPKNPFHLKIMRIDAHQVWMTDQMPALRRKNSNRCAQTADSRLPNRVGADDHSNYETLRTNQ